MPSVSVIIPAYNEEKCIERGIRCALTNSQTYLGELEIIVVDNNSSDGTSDIVQRIMKEQPQVKLEKQLVKGVSHTRNKGASRATGEYLIFLDADSQIGPGFLVKTITEMKTKALEVASCRAQANTPSWSNTFLLSIFNFTMILLQHTKRPVALGAAIVIKKDLHTMIDGFDPDMFYGEDSRYVTKAKAKSRYGVLKEPFIFDMRRINHEGKVISVVKLLKAFARHLLFGSTKGVKFRYDHDYH